MKSNELLSYLSKVESKLNSFSFEELSTQETAELKKSIMSFKDNLDSKTRDAEVEKNKTVTKLQPNRHLNNSQEMLIAKVSHEIRTPLNGIIGFTDLLAEEDLSERQQTHVNAIQSASNTLLNLINELLEHSKLSSGTSHFENVDFNLRNLITDVSYLCKTLIVNPEIDFKVSIADNVPSIINGDPSKLSQILLNLLGNAIKFVNKGSIELQIAVKILDVKNLTLDFYVKDTGIGIPKGKLNTIFDYYKQAEIDTQKNYGGTGLGLSIVKHIIETLQGKINVYSELGVGTTFNFTLPYIVSSYVQKDRSLEVDIDLSKQEEQIKTMSILVFEDNILNQKLIQNRLENWGCKCYVTDMIEKGMGILENEKIDVILMDLRMPETTGFEVSKRIRANKISKINTIPIIALTADLTIQDKKLCKESGINDYMLKPFDSKKLLHKLTTQINPLNIKDSMDSQPIVSRLNETDQLDVDLSNVLEECFGETDVLEELVRLYKNNAVEFIGKTKINLKNSDFEGIRFNTHKIKAGLKLMKTFGLYRIVEQMNTICKQDQDIKYLNFLYDCFLTEYGLVEKAIDSFITDLKNK
ncbi:response regulator [Cellulophaga baltica]|uniref:ATP-binding protein n=1 Tax=Cellulophaga TaxID=104264 RepID=UPI001C068AD4|nr:MULTISPECIES: ATP-binding protein [Cellulophaga]MBU2996229.1 response regulator [Cellulophaga baltica]MDO6767624.1 ATP-binding protein [Cellulophaga sp. 1_MG-2023]